MTLQKLIEKEAFRFSLTHPLFFREVVRRAAYKRCKKDPEEVHRLALRTLDENLDVLKTKAPEFYFPDLETKFGDRIIMPFGTAAGLDKNATALRPLSYIFGFQEPGTIIINPREGNPSPRVAIDPNKEDLYNAQGFPSEGIDKILPRMAAYRKFGGNAIIFANICGMPKDETHLESAFTETETLVDKLNPYVDAFVWNCFSPNTEALRALRTPETFYRIAEMIKTKAPNKPRLVKMGPYESGERKDWLNLVNNWLEGGGNGIVAVNTKMVPREEIPIKDWGYKSAGKSGRFLTQYRNMAIRETRERFPEAYIVATGGLPSTTPGEMLEVFSQANLVSGYTGYTYNGFGLLVKAAKQLQRDLHKQGFDNLQEYQRYCGLKPFVPN